MEARAYLKYVRISPRKVSIVLDLIRGKDAATAKAILRNTPKAASEHLIKLLDRTKILAQLAALSDGQEQSEATEKLLKVLGKEEKHG